MIPQIIYDVPLLLKYVCLQKLFLKFDKPFILVQIGR